MERSELKQVGERGIEMHRRLGKEQQVSTAPRTNVANFQIDIFLTPRVGDIMQRATKRTLLLCRPGMIPVKPQVCLNVPSTQQPFETTK